MRKIYVFLCLAIAFIPLANADKGVEVYGNDNNYGGDSSGGGYRQDDLDDTRKHYDTRSYDQCFEMKKSGSDYILKNRCNVAITTYFCIENKNVGSNLNCKFKSDYGSIGGAVSDLEPGQETKFPAKSIGNGRLITAACRRGIYWGSGGIPGCHE